MELCNVLLKKTKRTFIFQKRIIQNKTTKSKGLYSLVFEFQCLKVVKNISFSTMQLINHGIRKKEELQILLFLKQNKTFIINCNNKTIRKFQCKNFCSNKSAGREDFVVLTTPMFIFRVNFKRKNPIKECFRTY